MLLTGYREEISRPTCNNTFQSLHCIAHLDQDISLAISFRVDYPPGKDLGAYSTAAPTAVWISASCSKDLQTWQELGKSQIDIAGQTQMDGFTASLDPHGTPEERFKAVYMAHPPKEKIPALWAAYQKLHPRFRDVRLDGQNVMTCIYGATSPDGIKWTPIKEPLFVHKSDTDTTVYYDEWLGKYIMYTRLYLPDRRMVEICEAEDFRHWGAVQPLIWPGMEEPLSLDVYTNARTSYPHSGPAPPVRAQKQCPAPEPNALQSAEAGRSAPGPIENQELLLEQEILGHYGPSTPGFNDFGQRGQQMRKEQQQVRHGATVRETAINGKPPKTAPQTASNINSPCTGWQPSVRRDEAGAAHNEIARRQRRRPRSTPAEAAIVRGHDVGGQRETGQIIERVVNERPGTATCRGGFWNHDGLAPGCTSITTGVPRVPHLGPQVAALRAAGREPVAKLFNDRCGIAIIRGVGRREDWRSGALNCLVQSRGTDHWRRGVLHGDGLSAIGGSAAGVGGAVGAGGWYAGTYIGQAAADPPGRSALVYTGLIALGLGLWWLVLAGLWGVLWRLLGSFARPIYEPRAAHRARLAIAGLTLLIIGCVALLLAGRGGVLA